MRFGEAVAEAIRVLQESLIPDEEAWEARGDACGLALGKDEPVGYLGVPDEFRAFLSWGVDGVHEGFWIDAPDQTHPPYVVMVSPMDFDESIRIEARDVGRWLDLLRMGKPWDNEDALEVWEQERRAAVQQRHVHGLPPIPSEYDIPD